MITKDFGPKVDLSSYSVARRKRADGANGHALGAGMTLPSMPMAPSARLGDPAQRPPGLM